ncbi:MAG: MATE family efflux transporter [Clostridia bacterium]|nr:MATE family efflux transporter [Clostridia bacterium]
MLKRLYSIESLSKKLTLCGDIPSTGGLYKGFLKIAWPAMVESMLMSLVNLVDSVMVSSCGSVAVASVGLTNQPRMLFYAIFFALSIAVTAIVSRRKGQDDRDGANACLSQAIGLVAVLAVVLCGAGIAISEPLLVFSGANEETLPLATPYFQITMVGLVFTSFGLIINAAQRGSGNTKISMRTNIVANVTNIFFNYLLINGIWFFPELGVTGAAIATLIGNIASFSMSLFSLFGKNKYLTFSFKRIIHWNASLIKTIARVAVGAGVEQLAMRFGFFVYAKMVADLGTAELATHTICMSIITISFASGDGLSVAASALIGQNLGKRRPDLATLFAKAGQRIGLCMSVIIGLLLVLCGGLMLLMFTDSTDENFEYIMSVGRNITYIIAIVSPGQISQVIYNGALRGAGDTKFVAITSAISIGAIRPFMAWLLCYPCGMGLYGAWVSLLIDQYVRLAFSAYRFASGKWASVKV